MTSLGISKAAIMSGKSEQTLRRWATQKLVPATKAANGKWVFDQTALVQYLSANGEDITRTGVKAKQPKTTSEEPLIASYERQIQTLESTIDYDRKTIVELKTQLEVTRSEVNKLNQEIRAILSKETKASPTLWIRSKVQQAFGV